MNTVSSIVLLCFLFFSASLSAEYCTTDDAGNTVGCSMMVSTGDPMEPVIAFIAKRAGETRSWNLGVRVLLKQRLMLGGDSELRIDDGEVHTLNYVRSNQAEVTKGLLSESVTYALGEDLVQAIAGAGDEVRLSISTAESGLMEVVVSSGRLSELPALIAEAKEKL